MYGRRPRASCSYLFTTVIPRVANAVDRLKYFFSKTRVSVVLLPNTRELMKVRDRIYLFIGFKCLVTQLMQQATRVFLKFPLNRV